MRFARIQTTGGATTSAVLEGPMAQPITGDLFGSWKKAGKPLPIAGVKLLAPIVPVNLLCFGVNYRSHAEEGGGNPPAEPALFLKPTTCVTGHGSPIVIPASAPSKVDYESELAVVIGTTARNVARGDALRYVFGYTCANDISARDIQGRDLQWARAKAFDTFCPLGPWIETEIDPSKLRIRGRLNGKTMQDASTAQLVFDVSYLVSFLSQVMTLVPGTVILTGTPGGCAHSHQPPGWLAPGDTFEVEIEGIGVLSNPVVAA